MDEDNGITTIKVSKQTRERLGVIGNKDDTFDDIVRRLLDLYEYQKMEELLEKQGK